MRRQSVGTPFGVLFAFYLAAFLFFMVRSFLSFPGQEVLRVFRWPYAWSRSFLELMRYAIALTIAGVAVSYSLLSVPPGRGKGPFHRVVSSHLVGVVALAVLYAALVLGVQPWVRTNYDRLFSLSAQARGYLSQAEAAFDTGDKRSAVRSYEQYLRINEADEAAQSRLSELRTELYGEAGAGEPGASGPAADRPSDDPEAGSLSERLSEGLSPPELVERAQRFLEEGDFFSAYFYADLASQVDPRRADARRLAARARESIRSLDLTDLDKREAEVFEEKRLGFELYNSEEYLKSYRVFHALSQQAPVDPEVATYLEKSREHLAAQAFFLDEARAAEAAPGVEALLFLNGQREELREIVYLGRVTGTADGVFFRDVEVIGFTPDELAYHYGAPYGKLYQGQINLRGIERREPRIETRSILYGGSEPGRRGEVAEILPLAPELGLLSALRTERSSLEALSFFMLWRVRSRIAGLGHLEAPVGQAILGRILLPFSFLVLALAGLSVGWRFRADPDRRPRWPAYLLLPVFPLVALYLSSFYLRAQEVVLAFVMVRFGFVVALVVLLGLQALALFAALTALAGQRTDRA